MSIGFRDYLRRTLTYLKDIVVTDLVIALITGLTFLFKGSFSFLAYSERLFYAAVIVILMAGVVGIATMFAGRSFGIPMTIRRPAEAKALLDHFVEYRNEVEKRYDVSIKIFLTGLGCIGLSALVQTFLG